MDPPSKKRSIFGGITSLFRSSTAPPEDRKGKSTNSNSVTANAPSLPPPQPESNGASSPFSPAKRASEAQLSVRKIIPKPQGPSSKLSQSVSASEIAHRPAPSTPAPAAATPVPKRRPGDNPHKLAASTSTPALQNLPNPPAPATSSKATSFSGAPSTPRPSIFRNSLYARPAPATTYTQRVSSHPLTQSFPPVTPGRPGRAANVDINNRILSNTASTELFPMKIPEPPRHLTGEMLAKEVPEDPNRAGSIYADEYLAHLCPPEFDDLQRRQFFCILDLRRLKYAADEVFLKKDWKINILNFAKEYEKSRSLIMLRYGLYEFKTVRASEAVKREWKLKHGIPDSDDESGAPAKTNGGGKRKAEEDLEPSSSTFTHTASPNKRARATEAPATNKRKANDELEEESQPSKLQKPGSPSPAKTPSATKSVFESIANKTASPQTAPKSSLFSSSTAAKPNGSIFDNAQKTPATSSNIFGHLSDASKDEDNESDTGSEAEAEDETPAKKKKKTTVNGASSSAPSEGGESTQSRSIFDRITRDANGQPVRQLPEGGLFSGESRKRSLSPVKELPANNTWNASAGIKFATPGTSSIFGSSNPKPPATTDTIDFAASTTKKPEEAAAPAEAPKEATPTTNLFGAQTKATEEAPKPAATNIFGSTTNPTETSIPAGSLFSAKPATSTTNSLFGATTSAAGQKKDEESKPTEAAPAPAPATSTLFGAKPATTESPKTNLFQFGTPNKTETAPATQPQFGGLFGKPPSTETPTEKPATTSLFGTDASKPATTSSLFGSATTAADKPAATNLFGSTTTPADKPTTTNLFGSTSTQATSGSDEPTAKKFAFGGTTESKPTTSLFGSTTPAPATSTENKGGLFGATTTSATPATNTKPLFGSTPAPAQENKPLFGSSTTTAAPVFQFGSTPASTSTEQKPLFGATAATDSKPLFGSTSATSTEQKPLFGSSTTMTEQKPLFGSISTTATEQKPLFGSTSTTEAKPLFGAAPASTEQKSLFGITPSTTENNPASIFGNSSTSTEQKPLFGSAPASTEQKPLFGSTPSTTENKPAGLFGNTSTTSTSTPLFNFGSQNTTASQPSTTGSIFGSASASFTFTAGGSDGTIKNPFASDGSYSAPTSFNFGSGDSQSSSAPFTFGAGGGTPSFTFGASSDSSNASNNASSAPIFSFGASQPSSTPLFGQNNPPAASNIFASSLAPVGGTSTGTSKHVPSFLESENKASAYSSLDSPFTFGGASSLATTPAASTPEPSAANAAAAGEDQGASADADEQPQEQISLTDGGPGEEDESVVHEVRAKAVKLVTAADSSADSSNGSGEKPAEKKSNSPWKVMGVGPLRLLKHKQTGAVRMLLRAEPRGNIALNKLVLPQFTYKPDAATPKFIKFAAARDDGKGLETWMIQVKTPQLAQELAAALEEHKKANEKKDGEKNEESEKKDEKQEEKKNEEKKDEKEEKKDEKK
ncbi:uncharacterized protein CTHT_0052560 [Thermochaetoides thermophila DSM 1495]|uniref:Nucleoporin NUP152 n=1 Tax=Chaetomium thermophilum (strain DSM 1495 / CBS 144.50 / IMI 039719) TaxID=759272 RepID=NU152_CHATD|nr:hypothetical protein CTHT_0052560 [Thermochaetoides thermophila DSM 1495]G0SDP9.1 RecName: Full=Nucleoporin NUP152; AltName: Full=Nuclear pore protein NUP152 [Thermochaetoides thermophila DSM 1495]AEN86180.1 Nup152p [Thermochaetoides thermophila]EGS18650.1 hypothetical protein CTHT_0052560 [Thermochaetoides thermophila DSM 1495]